MLPALESVRNQNIIRMEHSDYIVPLKRFIKQIQINKFITLNGFLYNIRANRDSIFYINVYCTIITKQYKNA